MYQDLAWLKTGPIRENMKRRNVDVNGKLRRPVKRSKLGEGILGR